MNSKLRTLALVAVVAIGVVAGVTMATSHGSLTASPATPGETATHTATLTVENESGGSLTGFEVDYSGTGVDVRNVSNESIVAVGIDEGDDSEGDTVDQNVSDDLDSVATSNDGATLTFEFGGSYDLAAGDELVVVYENVQNGDAGEYEVMLDINPQSSGGEGAATLTIGEAAADATATGTEEADGDNKTTTQERAKNVTETENGTETMTGENETATDEGADGTETDTEESTTTDETTQEEAEETQEETEETQTEDENGVGETETEVGVGDDEQDGTVADGPGFGLALAVLALLGAAFVAMRRSN